MQALTAAGVDPTYWCCETAVTWLLAQQTDGDFGGVGATAQIIPFLGCNNFGSLKTIQIDCPNFGTPPRIMPGDTTVTFTLKVSFGGSPANQTYPVTIIDGESLFFGMIRLQDSDSSFTFQTQGSAFGEFLVSINGVTSNFAASLFWGIFVIENGMTSSANAGVEGLFPQDGDCFLFELTFFGK
ncbi:hypothetical protein BSL78_08225 [Apostichopus japonicus]|uniref:Uncharacterized protein n=1 Tax=Stichopus japonicus TaxID=307972 RepID=A0A2G8L3S7_STIJA|nr:hypothetical protein BSL78_08225 [Apostichopus japonicus]